MVTEGDSNIVISVPGDNGDQARAARPDRAAAVPPGDHRPPQRPRSRRPAAAPRRPPAAAPSGSAPPRLAAAPSPPRRHAPAAATSARPPPPRPTAAVGRRRGPNPDAAAGHPGAGDRAVRDADLRQATSPGTVDRPEDYVATCSEDGTAKYLLGPAVVEGTDVTDANPGTRQTTGEWIVQLDFNTPGLGDVGRRYTAANVGKQVGDHPRRQASSRRRRSTARSPAATADLRQLHPGRRPPSWPTS